MLLLFPIWKFYSKWNILFQFINNWNDFLHFISLRWLFLDLGPIITWNWKLKHQNVRRLFIIFNLKPVAYNLRHFLIFIFSFFNSHLFHLSIYKLWLCNKAHCSLIFSMTLLLLPRKIWLKRTNSTYFRQPDSLCAMMYCQCSSPCKFLTQQLSLLLPRKRKLF